MGTPGLHSSMETRKFWRPSPLPTFWVPHLGDCFFWRLGSKSNLGDPQTGSLVGASSFLPESKSDELNPCQGAFAQFDPSKEPSRADSFAAFAVRQKGRNPCGEKPAERVDLSDFHLLKDIFVCFFPCCFERESISLLETCFFPGGFRQWRKRTLVFVAYSHPKNPWRLMVGVQKTTFLWD